MKKIITLVLCLVFMLSVSCAESSLFETLAGMEWSFCSGVGGWSTDLQILADGSFTGQYHDSEMGDCADEYPDGTVYICAFSGRMSLLEQIDAKTWKIRVDSLEKEAAEEMNAYFRRDKVPVFEFYKYNVSKEEMLGMCRYL